MTALRCYLTLCTFFLLCDPGRTEVMAAAGTVGLPGNTALQMRSPTDAAVGGSPGDSRQLIAQIRREAIPLQASDDYRPLLDAIGEARFVLLGEATHGTREFYRARSDITRRLILEKGFDAIAIEGDWPHALGVNHYIRYSNQGGTSDARNAAHSAEEALEGFRRFPSWMWRNTEVSTFVDWLREHNGASTAATKRRVGFFGLDVYSPRASMDAVARYLDNTNTKAARRARSRYACFDRFPDAEQAYGEAVVLGGKAGCTHETRQQFEELMEEGNGATASHGTSAETLFEARQHARVVHNAEAYYRSMFAGANASWNARDTHMADTLDAIARHIAQRKGSPAKIVVWAHNTHVGDARATEMGEKGEINLGQLVRQRYGRERSFLVGFTTHAGNVMAASSWGGMPEVKTVLPSLPNSFSRLFHETGIGDFTLLLRDGTPVARHAEERRLERAIGVIYRPETERASHYFGARLARQFDAVIHFDHTRAVQPLDPLHKQ